MRYLVSAASWKLQAVLRTRPYYNDAEVIMMYKAHLLGFVEHRTPAIYHQHEQYRTDWTQCRHPLYTNLE